MPANVQKTPFSQSIERFADRKIASALELLGQSLPASVVGVKSSGIVTVKFELANVPFTLPQITVPIAFPEYVRLPIQQGMKGMVIAADAYLGGMSGLGGGTADLTPRPNLSNLVFVPLGNSSWAAPVDPNAVELYGPDGAILYSSDKTAMLKVTKTENSWTAPASAPITLNGNVIITGNLQIEGLIQNLTGGTYQGTIQTSGEITAKVGAGPVSLSTHKHTQPNDSHGDAEQPTASPTAGT